jgi:hypothetical protein
MRRLYFKLVLILVSVSILSVAKGQLALSILTGKNHADYSIGTGAFIKFSKPVSEAADATIELALQYFGEKEGYTIWGIGYVPLKLGYRYTLNKTGDGIYVEPQLGYNFYGVRSYQDRLRGELEENFKNIIWSVGVGYLMPEKNRFQFDLSLRYEAIYHPTGPNGAISLKLAHNFSFGKRKE